MKILTANRLIDGEAVWLCSDHSWAETIEAAEIARDAATEEKLERAGKAAVCKNEVVDLALVVSVHHDDVATNHELLDACLLHRHESLVARNHNAGLRDRYRRPQLVPSNAGR